MIRRRGLLHDLRGATMAEAALVLPVILLAIGLQLDGVRAGAASVAICNAANYGARIGSVSRENPEQFALDATNYALGNTGVRVQFSGEGEGVGVFSSGKRRAGGAVFVSIRAHVDTFFSGLCELFGGECSDTIQVSCGATYKKEGW